MASRESGLQSEAFICLFPRVGNGRSINCFVSYSLLSGNHSHPSKEQASLPLCLHCASVNEGKRHGDRHTKMPAIQNVLRAPCLLEPSITTNWQHRISHTHHCCRYMLTFHEKWKIVFLRSQGNASLCKGDSSVWSGKEFIISSNSSSTEQLISVNDYFPQPHSHFKLWLFEVRKIELGLILYSKAQSMPSCLHPFRLDAVRILLPVKCDINNCSFVCLADSSQTCYFF